MAEEFLKNIFMGLFKQYGEKVFLSAYNAFVSELKANEVKLKIKEAKLKGLVFDSLEDYVKNVFPDKKGELSFDDASDDFGKHYYLIQKTNSCVNRIPLSVYKCVNCGFVKYEVKDSRFALPDHCCFICGNNL